MWRGWCTQGCPQRPHVERLALLLLQAMDVEVARAAFIRLRDVRSVELVNRVAAGLAAGTQQNLLMADVAAWQGNFDQAAKLYVAEGEMDKVNHPVYRL